MTAVTALGLGDRACVDVCAVLAPGAGPVLLIRCDEVLVSASLGGESAGFRRVLHLHARSAGFSAIQAVPIRFCMLWENPRTRAYEDRQKPAYK